jgi:hypothetical protein
MARHEIERALDYSREVVEASPERNVRLIVNRESIDWSPIDDPAGKNGPWHIPLSSFGLGPYQQVQSACQ